MKSNRVAVYLPALAACLPFASTDNSRAYLTGVYVHWKDGATKYASTDGHKLCFAETEKAPRVAEALDLQLGEHAGIILSAVDAKELAGWATNDSKLPAHLLDAQHFAIMEAEGTNLTFTSYDSKLTKKCKAIDATYPDYKRVMPATDKEPLCDGPIGFNANYLADILKAARAGFSHRRAPSCKATFYGSTNAAKFEMSNPDQDRATIVIMPMRVQ